MLIYVALATIKTVPSYTLFKSLLVHMVGNNWGSIPDLCPRYGPYWIHTVFSRTHSV